jgi:hypothetical protein
MNCDAESTKSELPEHESGEPMNGYGVLAKLISLGVVALVAVIVAARGMTQPLSSTPM